MGEFLYGHNSVLISVVLLFLILGANEGGYRVGHQLGIKTNEGARTQTNAIQAAMLGLLALLLGFTFTMALQRFDSRSEAVIAEANAIGTAFLRTQLLPEPIRNEGRKLIEEYTEVRLRASQVDLTQDELRRKAKADASRLQERLWVIGLEAAASDPNPVTTGLFVQSLNELIDVYGKRDAALNKHVPEIVLLLLFGVFIIAGAVLGYAAGLSRARPVVATVAMAILIVLVIFIIIDLDRPRRGLIRVNQDSMYDLRETMRNSDASLPPSTA